MPTFLTSKKMDPALAARVEASVQGRRGQRSRGGDSRWAPRLVSLARLALVLAIAAVIAFVVLARRQDRRELERSRAALLEMLRSASAPLTPADLGAVERAETWLARASGAYEGDEIADDLRRPGALASLLSHPMVYVRGPIDAFRSPALIAGVAAASQKDPLLVCLVEPPAARTEKALFEKVRAAYSLGAEQHTPNVRRLQEAFVGLPFLQPAWADNVRTARTAEDIDGLRRDLQRAPLERARRAAKAELLLYAIDEPGEAGGPTELDGERPHEVRIGLVQLEPAKVLLRLRKHVDPSWITTAKRPEYASALDGCRMAFDVHESVNGVGAGVVTGDAHAGK
jgi:hypothetical protein